MLEDVECPYCGKWVEIDHDDGEGYKEGVTHNQACKYCEKYFAFTTSVSFSYDAQKADCLNDGEHKWKATYTYPAIATRMECEDCGETRRPTEAEMAEVLKENPEG